MADDEFETVDAGSSDTYPMQAGSIRKGGYVVMNNRPCKVVEVTTSKTGKHGHAKAHIIGLDIFTQKKIEDLCPTSHNMNVPNVNRTEYQLMNIDDGFTNLLAEDGSEVNHLKVPEGDLGTQLTTAFDAGQEVTVTVIQAMGEEAIMTVRAS
eukprot:CAMPEP_0117029194 /NCGR_PEP_ID=MMETSP0472-20121206/21163_1 /TAXON_ID=693140 ORGANISM="Tiarina fusus, Strain LIS" /NCGR_SAMPLE_ID=MMETSP0472 /ASSEMBLY_ACC=CAM_ASM_000603 /LENGTH=151 /DNA_ID=CAMNT_0004736897 /DNA_START=16 /DNA_END=471 /DNA_ORIENTATION=+